MATSDSLEGKPWVNTYKDLLQVPNSNDGVDTTARAVQDGEGTETPLKLSSTVVDIDTGFKIGGVAVTATAANLNSAADVVSQALAEAGTSTVTYAWTPERVKQAIAALSTGITASSSDTLTNKSIDFATNTLTTTKAQLNTAISDGSVVTSGANSSITSLTGLTTPLTVPQGGMGAATYTDGGILLGSGTGPVTAMSVLADGEIIVGDGTTDPVALAAFDSSTGNLVSTKSGTVGLQTIWVPVTAMRPTITAGCSAVTDFETTSGRPDFQVMYFDGASDEHAQFSVAMPKGWAEGTVTAQFIYGVTDAAATDGTDTVSFALQGVSVVDDESVDQAYGTAVVVTDTTPGTVEDLSVTATTAAITIAGTKTAGSNLVFFRVFRDVSADDMTEDAGLVGLRLFFTIDTGEDT